MLHAVGRGNKAAWQEAARLSLQPLQGQLAQASPQISETDVLHHQCPTLEALFCINVQTLLWQKHCQKSTMAGT